METNITHGGKGDWVEQHYDFEDGSSCIVGELDDCDDCPVCILPPGSPWSDLIENAPCMKSVLEQICRSENLMEIWTMAGDVLAAVKGRSDEQD